jgi:hypothetical protein
MTGVFVLYGQYCPMGQMVHAVWRVAVVYYPLGQGVGTAEPSGQKYPTGQGVAAAAFTVPYGQ